MRLSAIAYSWSSTGSTLKHPHPCIPIAGPTLCKVQDLADYLSPDSLESLYPVPIIPEKENLRGFHDRRRPHGYGWDETDVEEAWASNGWDSCSEIGSGQSVVFVIFSLLTFFMYRFVLKSRGFKLQCSHDPFSQKVVQK